MKLSLCESREGGELCKRRPVHLESDGVRSPHERCGNPWRCQGGSGTERGPEGLLTREREAQGGGGPLRELLFLEMGGLRLQGPWGSCQSHCPGLSSTLPGRRGTLLLDPTPSCAALEGPSLGSGTDGMCRGQCGRRGPEPPRQWSTPLSLLSGWESQPATGLSGLPAPC